ncbi:MAG TPA: hypothetical protein VIT24_09805 [Acidimicrobiales bacterium]
MTSARILQVATWSTVVLAVFAAGAVALPETLAVPYAVVGFAYFIAGCAAFLWSYGVAVGRSRTDELSVAGIYFLTGSAPSAVKRRLLGAVVVQSAIAVAAAAARPFTAVAFGVLAPLFALGLTGLWGARFGTFPERHDKRGRRPASS